METVVNYIADENGFRPTSQKQVYVEFLEQPSRSNLNKDIPNKDILNKDKTTLNKDKTTLNKDTTLLNKDDKYPEAPINGTTEGPLTEIFIHSHVLASLSG